MRPGNLIEVAASLINLFTVLGWVAVCWVEDGAAAVLPEVYESGEVVVYEVVPAGGFEDGEGEVGDGGVGVEHGGGHVFVAGDFPGPVGVVGAL